LFGKFGALKKAFVHYDRNARSQGSATVIFASKQAALSAIREYNNVALDGMIDRPNPGNKSVRETDAH